MTTRKTFLAAAALAAIFAAAGAALAHPGYGPGAGPGMGPGMGYGMHGGMHGGMGMGPGMGPGMHGGMGPGMGPMGRGGWGPGTDIGARLADTKAALKITATQEAAWSAYADVVTRQAEARTNFRDKMRAQMADPKATLPDREAMRETMLKFGAEMQNQRATALKNLYAVLTPEQKAQADRTPWAFGGHAMGGRGPWR